MYNWKDVQSNPTILILFLNQNANFCVFNPRVIYKYRELFIKTEPIWEPFIQSFLFRYLWIISLKSVL